MDLSIDSFTHKDKDKILKYIALLYDERSELNQIMDINERKIKACTDAGLDSNSKTGQELINLSNEKINQVVFYHLSRNNHNKYVQLCADQHLFWEMQMEILKPIEATEKDERLKEVEYKDKISVRSGALLQRVNQLYNEIYKGDAETQIAVKTIHDMATYEQRLKKRRSNDN